MTSGSNSATKIRGAVTTTTCSTGDIIAGETFSIVRGIDAAVETLKADQVYKLEILP